MSFWQFPFSFLFIITMNVLYKKDIHKKDKEEFCSSSASIKVRYIIFVVNVFTVADGKLMGVFNLCTGD